MKITASMLAELAAMPPEAMAVTLRVLASQAAQQEADEARAERKREMARERQRRAREKRDQSVMSRENERDVTRDPSPKERSPTPPKEITPSLSSEAIASSDSKRTPTDELATVLDRAHAEAVVAHRKAMRKPLTPHAARLLAEKFAKAADPNAGADTMIASGWQGFEPAWMARATGPPGGRSQNGAAAATLTILKELADERSNHHQAERAADRTDSGTTPDAFSVDQWRDSGRRPDGSSPRQAEQRGRAPSHAGPVIDLEAVPRRA